MFSLVVVPNCKNTGTTAGARAVIQFRRASFNQIEYGEPLHKARRRRASFFPIRRSSWDPFILSYPYLRYEHRAAAAGREVSRETSYFLRPRPEKRDATKQYTSPSLFITRAYSARVVPEVRI